MKRAQVRRTVRPKTGGMTKPFRPEAFVATFADTALRAALAELRVFEHYPAARVGKHWTITALRQTLAKTLNAEPETLTLLVPALLRAEAARRWAKEYDRAMQARLRESKKKSKRRQPKTRKHQ